MKRDVAEATQHEDAFDRLRLIRSANIGPVTYVQLIKRFGSAGKALDALPELAKGGGARAPRIADAQQVETELRAIEKLSAKLLFLGDPDYPHLLSELDNAPPVLIWRGHLEPLQKPVVAIVGARNASAAACRFARDLADGLTASGISVASGLARGIDTAAHQGSLQRATIGVIAGGIDIYFPPENEELQNQIADRGLLLSEQPPGTVPHARHFPFRNRIIAGLARGTVVVEAAPRSGSLITARLAGEAGRQVMAVPGSPLDPRSRGCNGLIREGANLIQSADDVLELIQHFDDRAEEPDLVHDFPYPKKDTSDLLESNKDKITDANRNILLGLLSMTPVSIDELVRQSGFPPEMVQLVLLELELAGRLSRHAGTRISLKN